MVPKTRYAANGSVNLAYQVIGEGPLDLVFVPPGVSNLEYYWEEPSCDRFFTRLASFARLILFDKRGAGLSDPIIDRPSLHDLTGDIEAVLDTCDSESAALLGALWGGPQAISFAATRPGRTTALILYGTFATRTRSDDYPWAPTAEERRRNLASFTEGWTEGGDLEHVAPSMADDERFRQWWARMRRFAASPGALRNDVDMMAELDVRGELDQVKVPTLVVHRSGDRLIEPANGRYLAEHIPGARHVELAGDDHLPFVGDSEAIVDQIEEFLTGAAPRKRFERVLATVMFTDICGSTARADAMGDRRWRDLLEAHHSVVRKLLDRFGGREIKTIGDAFMVAFDAPAGAIRCAQAIRDGVQPLGIQIKAGLHTGECEVMGEDLGGMTVHIASRVVERAAPGEVLVSRTLKELVPGSGLEFRPRGAHELKGVPGEWELFAVAD
ncbi:MAG: alpha/beta fold hydrolase [Actinomycetota bacterium]